ncbi:unnamed protein product [Brachionus calyciflorus]|uniref:MULE transposase domain-containing protein n=1 Tax=Brachionus calyciflorus TaxID=104777 RepID=A0A814P3B2_9BILA|nr:unnamed protein product [Brachionus calyciflorus]
MSKCVDELINEEEIAVCSSNDADPQFISRIKKLKKPFYLQISVDDPERFFVSGSLSNVKLIENGHIFVDGTFEISPEPFLQVYSIHLLIDNKCYPVLYGLLPRKTQKMYERFLSCIEVELESNPTSINCDYEKAMINAAQKIFRQISVFGCFFHLNQSISRNIQKFDLDYIPPNDLRDWLKKEQKEQMTI